MSSPSSPCRLGLSQRCLKIRTTATQEQKSRVTAEPERDETVSVIDRKLMVRGQTVLTEVSDTIVIKPLASGSVFIGATVPSRSCRHLFTLGVLEELRWVCLFRYIIWWMIPRMGKSGSDIPLETQMLLLEVTQDVAAEEATVNSNSFNTFYILLLPILDGAFRASLQGNSANELQLCLESGDPDVQTSQAFEALFLNSGHNPFELIRESIKILAECKGTFSHIVNKKIPANLDWFGWCTWDAFYTEVNPQGIKEGLQSLVDGGTPPRFLIIDDGWQDTVNEFSKDGEPFIEGTQFTSRLVGMKENRKFRSDGTGSTSTNLGKFIKDIKDIYGLKYVYMWHALVGYWGGLLSTSEEMKKYNPMLKFPIQSPGNTGNVRDIVIDSLDKYGVGIIDPAHIYEFYNDLHTYLSSQGVDGVKVDVQNVVETLGPSHGGRVSLTRQYQLALEESIARNFEENNLICCMCHNSDYIYSSKKSAVARASEDFMPGKPEAQTLQIASVSFNSLLLGEIVIPDWDMFHSNHSTAEFHAAARAIGGCGVYVSDKPGHHDFKILKKIVLPDGSVLRAKYAGRPTRDCLFNDPLMDGKSLLKIWNLNKFSGVIGIFNCQGAGNWPMKEQKNSSSDSAAISGNVSPSNIEFLDELSADNWNGDCALFAFSTGNLSRLSKRGSLDVSLAIIQCEVFTVSPIKDYNQTVQFAPLGLINMYNSGGAIEELKSIIEPSGCRIEIKSRGPGKFGAYSSMRPNNCTVDTVEEEFVYNPNNGFLTFSLPHISSKSGLRVIEIVY